MTDANYTFGPVTGPVQTGSGVQYTAGRDQNVAHGDQYIAGRNQAIAASAGQVLAELASLRRALDELRLTAEQRRAAEYELNAASSAMGPDSTDRTAAVSHLSRFVQGLKDAGVLVSAGTSLVDSIRNVAGWLGPAAAAIIHLL